MLRTAQSAILTPNIHTPKIGVLWAILIAATVVAFPACRNTQNRGEKANEQALDPYRAEGQAVFAANPPPPPADGSPFAQAAPGQDTRNRWVISLASVPGDTRVIGEQMLRTTQTEGGLPEAYLAERGGKLLVAMGSYEDPGSPQAQADLARVQAVEVRGGRPYAFAFMAPPESGAGSNPAHDLRRARAQFGPKALYTLQVAIYGHADGRTPTPEELQLFRKTAEEAVARLRAEGELAFYYHDRTRSSVTVGVFGEEDHDASVRPPYESVRLEQTRQRHPNNLLNGQGIKEIATGSDGRRRETIQKSFLVAVPK